MCTSLWRRRIGRENVTVRCRVSNGKTGIERTNYVIQTTGTYTLLSRHVISRVVSSRKTSIASRSSHRNVPLQRVFLFAEQPRIFQLYVASRFPFKYKNIFFEELIFFISTVNDQCTFCVWKRTMIACLSLSFFGTNSSPKPYVPFWETASN